MRAFILCLLLVGSSVGFAKTAAVSASSKKADNPERRALDLVRLEYKKYGKNVSGLKPECVDFSIEDATASAVTIREREVHGAKCGGDPESHPVIATFVVRGKKVFIVDPVSGDTIPFDKRFKSDGP